MTNEATPVKKSRATYAAILGGVTVLLGVTLALVLAPKLLEMHLPSPQIVAGDGLTGLSGAGVAGEPGVEGSLVDLSLPGFVINPAGTSGRRYLLVSVTLQVEPVIAERMMENEATIRDRITEYFSQKGLAELASMEARDDLREGLRLLLEAEFPGAAIEAVLLPTYVIRGT